MENCENTIDTNDYYDFLTEAIEPTKDEYDSAMAEYELDEDEYIAIMKHEEEEILDSLYDLIINTSKDIAA